MQEHLTFLFLGAPIDQGHIHACMHYYRQNWRGSSQQLHGSHMRLPAGWEGNSCGCWGYIVPPSMYIGDRLLAASCWLLPLPLSLFSQVQLHVSHLSAVDLGLQAAVLLIVLIGDSGCSLAMPATCIKGISNELENDQAVRDRHRESNRFVFDSKKDAVDAPVMPNYKNIILNESWLIVFLHRMKAHKSKKCPAVHDIEKELAIYHKKWGAALDGLQAYTEKWNVKRFCSKIRVLWSKFLKRPVMDGGRFSGNLRYWHVGPGQLGVRRYRVSHVLPHAPSYIGLVTSPPARCLSDFIAFPHNAYI